MPSTTETATHSTLPAPPAAPSSKPSSRTTSHRQAKTSPRPPSTAVQTTVPSSTPTSRLAVLSRARRSSRRPRRSNALAARPALHSINATMPLVTMQITFHSRRLSCMARRLRRRWPSTVRRGRGSQRGTLRPRGALLRAGIVCIIRIRGGVRSI